MTERDDVANVCSGDATCAEGGDTHCAMYQKYAEVLDEADDGCCVVGCYLDVDKMNVK